MQRITWSTSVRADATSLPGNATQVGEGPQEAGGAVEEQADTPMPGIVETPGSGRKRSESDRAPEHRPGQHPSLVEQRRREKGRKCERRPGRSRPPDIRTGGDNGKQPGTGEHTDARPAKAVGEEPVVQDD